MTETTPSPALTRLLDIPNEATIVVGFSGGTTSAWCAGWAIKTYGRERVVLLWHDTKEEHPDTYRFLREMAAALEMPIVERSDGRSVTEVFRDEGYLGNNQNAMCSRILKVVPGDRYMAEVYNRTGHRAVKVLGYSAREWPRIQRAQARANLHRHAVAFPVAALGVTKQETADWCRSLGVRPSAMYEWADHANCIGCVKGGKEYWLAVAEHAPEVYAQRAALEEEFGHGILRGGNREHYLLRDLVQIGMKRPRGRREKIEIGPCECGD